jgi:MFS family permease
MTKTPTKKQLKANIWKFYLISILGGGIGFFIPISILFWQENGLSFSQIMILQSCFSLSLVFMEIPSGYVADVIGRKKSLVLTSIFYITSIIVYIFSYNFSSFLFAEILMAIGFSFLSGADSAFIYDTLKDLKQETRYKKIWGNKLFFGLTAMAIFNLIGGYIGSIDLRTTWYFTLATVILILPIVLTLKEPQRHKLIFKKGYTKVLINIIHKKIIKQAKLKWLIIYAGIAFAFFQGTQWLYVPYFELLEIPIKYFGALYALFTIFSAISSKQSHKIEEYIGEQKSITLLTILTGIGLLLMSKFIFILSIAFILIFQFIRGFYTVIISDYINKLTDSSIRATVLSAQNLIARIFYALLMPVFGYLTDIYTLQQTLGIMGLTILIIGGGLLLIMHRYKLV